MGRFLKVLLFLIILGVLGLVAFAYFGDLTPVQEDRSVPVEIDGT